MYSVTSSTATLTCPGYIGTFPRSLEVMTPHQETNVLFSPCDKNIYTNEKTGFAVTKRRRVYALPAHYPSVPHVKAYQATLPK